MKLQFEGDVKDAAHAPITEALSDGLGRAGAGVVDFEQVVGQDRASTECADNACLAAAAERLDATHVVTLKVVATGNDYDIELTLIDRGGKQSKRAAQCQICGFAEVATMVGDEARAFGPALLRGDAPASFHIESNPSGAEVQIDGEVVGETPLDVEVAPGPHLVAVTRRGYSTAQSELVGVPGVEERLVLGLVETLEQLDPAKTRRLRVGGWSLVGVGIGLAGGGAAALALHHNEPSKRCTPEVIDINGICQWRYNTLPIGIPLVATAAASIITGSILAAIAGRREPKADQAKLRVGVGFDGIVVSGQF